MLKRFSAWIQLRCLGRQDNHERGGVLIGAVVAMVVMGALGAGMVSMLGTTALHEVRANHGERAYYLAESGFRFANSTFRQGGKAALEGLLVAPNDTTFAPGGGSFTIITEESETEKSEIRDGGQDIFSVDGTQTVAKGGNLRVIVEDDEDDEDVLPSRNGFFRIASEPDRLYRYLRFDSNTSTLENIIGSGHDDFPVVFVDEDLADVVASAKLVIRGEFPGSGYLNVARSVTYWWPLPEEALATFDPDDFPGGQRPDYKALIKKGAPFRLTNDDDDDDYGDYGDHSRIVRGRHDPGSGYTYDLIVGGYDDYLDLEDELDQEIRYQYVPFKRSTANLDMVRARELNNDFLSYDVQVKVATGPRLSYASMGFMFRGKRQESYDNGDFYYSGYGISFMRYNWPITYYDNDGVHDDRDFIPPGVKPDTGVAGNEKDSLLLVLWEQTGHTTWQWLAYKNLEKLVPHTFVRGQQHLGDGYFIHHDSTLMIRVVERMVAGVRSNDIQLFFGDARWSSNNQASRLQDNNAFNVNENRFGYHQRLSPTDGEELWRWPSLPNISATHWNNDSDWFSAVEWDRVNPASSATATRHLDETGKFSIIRDAGHTSLGFSNNQVRRPELVLHVFGNTASFDDDDPCSDYKACGPVHFNDFAVRLLQGSSITGGAIFLPPIQQ